MKRRLCVQATSVACERLFSKAGMTILNRKTSLKPKKASEVLFLHQNLEYFFRDPITMGVGHERPGSRNNLLLVDNTRIPDGFNDAFYKACPIFDALRNRCLELPLGKELYVDEQIVSFTGKQLGN